MNLLMKIHKEEDEIMPDPWSNWAWRNNVMEDIRTPDETGSTDILVGGHRWEPIPYENTENQLGTYGTGFYTSPRRINLPRLDTIVGVDEASAEEVVEYNDVD